MQAEIKVVVKFSGGGSWTHTVTTNNDEQLRTLMEYVTSIEGE